MEIELKLRFSVEAFRKAIALFNHMPGSKYICTEIQENHFFDNKINELEGQKINFRVRSVLKQPSGVSLAFLTMKGKGAPKTGIQGGISRVTEIEQEIPREDLAAILENPRKLAEYRYAIIQELLDSTTQHDFQEIAKFINTRRIYQWAGLTLECDETTYKFGKAYEIEVESSEPEKAKQLLTDLLKTNKIDYEFSRRGKYGNMKAGKII